MISTLLLVGMVTFVTNIREVEAYDWIIIEADGSIDPPDAPISRVGDNVYLLTGSTYECGIIVRRDNIVIDGVGYDVQGWQADGITLFGRNNVTIKRMTIKAFGYGINLAGASFCTIFENNITDNGVALEVHDSSNNNTFRGNNIANNNVGFEIFMSDSNIISENNITGSWNGVDLRGSYNNRFHHNNFVDNENHIYFHLGPCANIWDDGYPSGGNYWSNYEERYPDAEELDDSGIWDIPYVFDENNQDNYPLMKPWTPIPPIPTTIDQLKTEIEELHAEDEIDNQGIITSLLAKLNTAQKLIDEGKINQAKNLLNAFLNEAQAQSGKHITQEAADILIESAEYILSNL